MAKAKQLPSGNWRVQASITVDGKRQVKSFTASDKKAAELAALNWQTSNNSSAPLCDLKLSNAVEKYINNNENTLSATSIIAYKKYQRNYFLSLANKKILAITKYDFDAEINKMLETLSPKTVRCAVSFYCTVIAYYTSNRLEIKLPTKQKKIFYTPSVEDIKKIIKAAEKSSPQLHLAVVLGAWFGMRSSEVRGLRWDKIIGSEMIIDTALVRVKGKQIEQVTKTAATTRKMRMPPYIKDLLDKMPHVSDYVIPLSDTTLRRNFKKLLEESGVPDCRFHDLRHANASIMLMLGIPNKYAMEHGGWATDSTLKKIYQETYTDEKIKVAEKINDFFNTLTENSHEKSHVIKKYRLLRHL